MSANPVVHQITFAIIMSTAVFYSTYLSYRLPAQLKSKALSTIWKGVGVFVVGFAIWNLDNHMCHHLRDFRDLLSANHLGFLAPLTEGEL
jgi:dihydroceramidase